MEYKSETKKYEAPSLKAEYHGTSAGEAEGVDGNLTHSFRLILDLGDGQKMKIPFLLNINLHHEDKSKSTSFVSLEGAEFTELNRICAGREWMLPEQIEEYEREDV
jgi:hypothetical protein